MQRAMLRREGPTFEALPERRAYREDRLKPECTSCPVLTSEVFRNVSSDEVSRFTCIFVPTRYKRSQILFFEGAAAQHIFALRSGLVKMVKPLENGKERITRVLIPGEIFGLEALAEATYPLSAVVLQDAEICAISREQFYAFLRSNPDFTLEIVRFLVGEVARVRTQMTAMSFKDARRRVVTFILSLLSPDQVGPAGPGTCSLTLPLSSQEIGDVLELSPETVSRTWNILRREGLIEKRGRRLLIQDLKRFENAASR